MKDELSQSELEQHLRSYYTELYGVERPVEETWAALVDRLGEQTNRVEPVPFNHPHQFSQDGVEKKMKQVSDNETRYEQEVNSAPRRGRFGLAKWVGLAASLLLVLGLAALVLLNTTTNNDKATPTSGAAAATAAPLTQPAKPFNMADLPGLQEITLSPALANALKATLPGSENAKLSLFVSEAEVAALTNNTYTTLTAAGYAYYDLTGQGRTKPAEAGPSQAIYTKSGQPDFFLTLGPISNDVITSLKSVPNVDETELTRLAEQLKGHKTLMVVATGNALAKASGTNQARTYPALYLPSTEPFISGQLGHSVELSQTVDGVRLTVRHIYVDVNYVVVGYESSNSTTNQALQTVAPFKPQITDNAGKILSKPNYTTMGSQPGSQPNTGQALSWIVFRIDGAFQASSPASFHLILSKTGFSKATAPASGQPVAEIEAGPFDFQLNTTVEASKVVKINQTIKAGDDTLVLEQAVITPLGMVLSLQRNRAFGADEVYVSDLNVFGKDLKQANNTSQSLDNKSPAKGIMIVELFQTDLLDKTGDVVLTLKPFNSIPANSPTSPAPVQIVGMFKFTVS